MESFENAKCVSCSFALEQKCWGSVWINIEENVFAGSAAHRVHMRSYNSFTVKRLYRENIAREGGKLRKFHNGCLF